MSPPVVHRSGFVYRVILLAALASLVVISVRSLKPPSRDPERFSSQEALKHLQFIASETHPVGLPHHKAVHDYLMIEFAKLGYEVQTQEAHGSIPLSNVLARRPGQVPENKAVMLAAHYDSVRWGPGAGDDGAGVAALLEVAREMSTSFYRNDIIFLITDGEEMGLWGAKLFIENHPWANDVGLVLNFDARGTSGPSIMYETSEDNGWLIDQYAQFDPHPVCGSMTQEVYQRMPNLTDFTVFRRKLPGLNFAFIGSYWNYHTENDTVENVDIASMRHHGAQALALAERFAQQDLSHAMEGGKSVYFDVLSRRVVHYPQSWAPWIAAFASVACLALLGLALANRSISIVRLGASCAVLTLNLVMVSAFAWALLWALRRVSLNQYANGATAGFALLACAVTVAVFYAAGKLSSLDLAAAGLVVWTILTLLSGFVDPGYSYLTVWPLLFSAMGFAFAVFFSKRTTLAGTLVLAISALPAVILWPRVLYLAFLGLKVAGVLTVTSSKVNIPVTPLLVLPIVLVLWLLPLQIGPAPSVLPQPPEAE